MPWVRMVVSGSLRVKTVLSASLRVKTILSASLRGPLLCRDRFREQPLRGQ
jgi:hypothetical protein